MNDKMYDLCYAIMEHVKVIVSVWTESINYAASGDFINSEKKFLKGNELYRLCTNADAELTYMIENGVIRETMLIYQITQDKMVTLYHLQLACINLNPMLRRISALERHVDNLETRVTRLEELIGE